MTLIIILIAWILGIIWGLYLKVSMALFLLIIIIFFNMLFKSIKNKKVRRYYKVIISKKRIVIFILCFFISYFQIQSYEQSFKTKYQNVQGEVKITGTIISNVKNKPYKEQYILKVDTVNHQSYKGMKLLLNVKKEKKNKVLQYGDKITLEGEFTLAETQRNTGRF